MCHRRNVETRDHEGSERSSHNNRGCASRFGDECYGEGCSGKTSASCRGGRCNKGDEMNFGDDDIYSGAGCRGGSCKGAFKDNDWSAIFEDMDLGDWF